MRSGSTPSPARFPLPPSAAATSSKLDGVLRMSRYCAVENQSSVMSSQASGSRG